jgi:hypothetical protein
MGKVRIRGVGRLRSCVRRRIDPRRSSEGDRPGAFRSGVLSSLDPGGLVTLWDRSGHASTAIGGRRRLAWDALVLMAGNLPRDPSLQFAQRHHRRLLRWIVPALARMTERRAGEQMNGAHLRADQSLDVAAVVGLLHGRPMVFLLCSSTTMTSTSVRSYAHQSPAVWL